jgi:3-dehydroquinate synthase
MAAVEAAAGYVGRFDGSQAQHASPAMAAIASAHKNVSHANRNEEADPSSLPTATRWSVLSSRVEGLVAELSEVVGKQDAYCVSQSKCEGPAMAAVREKMLATPWAKLWSERQTMFSYGEEMSTDPLEAMFLKQMTFMCAPRRVLEIGMFVGYGSVAMLEGSSSAQVVSLEIDPFLKGWLSSCLVDAGLPEVSKRHEVVVGPALESLPKLSGEFDMVFVDANKAEYKAYVELILEHKLLSQSGVIICDNVLYNGYPYVHSHFDSQPARRGFGNEIKEFNQWICDHASLEQVILPVRDGISIIRQRQPIGGTKASAPGSGNLAQYDDTWHILKEGEVAPANALMSNCRIDVSASEYVDKASEDCPRAWMSKSLISFDYRVVEVPSGKLLDPACDALIFGHLPFGSPEREAAMSKPQRRLVVIDETVDNIYGEKVRSYFETRGVVHEILRLPLVEENKSVEMTLKVCEKMKKFNIDRRTEPVIAIGGGVCMDVVGLAASLFRRRTPYIRVPTTALGYVDASVGAKNGCNFLGSKNRLGTYVPPAAALLDSSFFKSQQRREVSNSLGEMCKMAIMKSEELFHLLEKNGLRLIERRFEPENANDDVGARVLRLSIETMLEELAPNLWEHCLDRLVDFGHGIGQNLEMSALGTADELMHGEAVACDMAYMSVLSNLLGLITTDQRDAILNLLRGCELPVYSPVFTWDFFKEAMEDRVQNSMGQRLPMPVGIGKAKMVNNVSDADFERAFIEWQKIGKA